MESVIALNVRSQEMIRHPMRIDVVHDPVRHPDPMLKHGVRLAGDRLAVGRGLKSAEEEHPPNASI